MRKKITGIVILISITAFAAGCGNKIPEMTEQQQELIVEYAAGTVLKYDKNYESKLVELTLEETVESEPVKEEEAPDSENEEEEVVNGAGEEVTVIDNTEAVTTVASIEEFLQIDSVAITYTGYETCDMYPENTESSELYFFMNATQGNKLLVLKFNIENFSDAEKEVNIAQSNVRFKVSVDGVEKNALTTMLLNDLAYYNGMLAAGESAELVLVCEVPVEQSENISSLALVLKNVDNEATISLY